jgi:hypothetical protein
MKKKRNTMKSQRKKFILSLSSMKKSNKMNLNLSNTTCHLSKMNPKR